MLYNIEGLGLIILWEMLHACKHRAGWLSG